MLNNAARTAGQIQREQQLRSDAQQSQDAARAHPPTELQAPEPAPNLAGEGGGCRNVTAIQLIDARHMPAGERAAIAKPYLGRCLTARDVGALLAAITRYYVDKGYSTSRAYIPGQDLSGGELKILIVEGKVSALKLEGKGVFLPGAFPGVVGSVFNLRDFEQGLDQVNRLASNNATIDLRPGDQPGDTVVAIVNKPSSPFHLTAGYDNYGVRSTGQDEGSLTLSIDHPLGINDFLSLTRSQSYISRGKDASDSDSLFYSVPYGWFTLSLGGSASTYRNSVSTPNGSVLQLSGDSETAYARLERMVYRSQTTRITVGADLTAKIFDNDLDGERLATSSRDLTVLDLTISGTRNLTNGALNGNLGFTQGLKLFDALHDASDLPGDAPRAQYRKLSFGAGYVGSFPVLGKVATVSSQWSGQYSFDVLYATEQLTLGGPYTVRGFYDSFLANDSGLYVRNDVSITQALGSVLGRPASVRPYVGLDGGFVAGSVKGTAHGGLGSVVFGVGLNVLVFSVDLFVGHPFAEPSTVHQDGFNPFVRVSLSL